MNEKAHKDSLSACWSGRNKNNTHMNETQQPNHTFCLETYVESTEQRERFHSNKKCSY